jgi:DNA transformation protein and related proteins
MALGFAESACDRLARAVPIRRKHMFGGTGLFSGKLFFAIVTDDAVYFKADEGSRAEFEGRGMEPFHPFGDAQVISCWRVPAEVLDDPDELPRWIDRALEAAQRPQTV